MSNIVWSADKGWHDGPEATVTVENGRLKVEPVTTWADGFGVWHAKVPNKPHRHEMTAYQAIRAELTARQGAPLPAFGLAVVEETEDTITYRESWKDNR